MPDVRPLTRSMLETLNELAIGGRRERAHDYYIGFIKPFYRHNAHKMKRGFFSDPMIPWSLPITTFNYETMSGTSIDITLDHIGFSLNSKNYRLELSNFGDRLQNQNEFAILASYIDIREDDCVFVGRYSHFTANNRSNIIQDSYIINMHRKNPVPFKAEHGLSHITEKLSLDLAFETYFK